jgi:hypothetical protein
VSRPNRRRVRIMRGRCMLNRLRPIDGLPTKLIISAAQVVAGGYTCGLALLY